MKTKHRVAAPVVPAPGADAKLWCVNVIGPDDVYATRTRLEALEEANWQNIYLSGLERHEYDPVLHAVVIEWPHSASSHADDLRSGVPTATTATQPQAAPVAQLSEPPDPFTDDEMVCAAWALLGAAKGTKQAKAFNVGARWARSHLTSASTIPKE